MADVKQIMTQGANTERVIDPFIVSTGRVLMKAELRADGVDVDNIAKYADLHDTAHVFPTFSGDQQLAVCHLALRALLFDENNDNDIQQTFSLNIESVTVSSVVEEINTQLAGNGVVDFFAELRHNRLQITARRAQAHIRVDELHILDSRGQANAESVNDLSNPSRLFNYFWPDARAISKRGAIVPAPPRDAFVTTQSVGVSQGEPRTSASLNRGLSRHAEILDETSLLSEFESAHPRKVRVPIEITQDALDLSVGYTSDLTPPRVVWSSTSFADPGGQGNVINNQEPYARRGGLSAELPHTVTVLAVRGVSLAKSGLTARIVNAEGEPRGLISPDAVRRGGEAWHDATELDHGVPFLDDSSRWRVVSGDITIGQHLLIPDPLPLTRYLAFPEGDPLIDQGQFEVLGSEAGVSTAFTRVDDVTLELESPVPAQYRWARIRLDGSDRSLIAREWVNDRRVIVSEIPDELVRSGHYPQRARLDELDSVNLVFVSRGPLVNPNEWFFIARVGSAGPLQWTYDEQLYLEVDAAYPPSAIGGVHVLEDFDASLDLAAAQAISRSSAPRARSIADRGRYTLRGAFEAPIGGMTLRHATGIPYDVDTLGELLNRAQERIVSGPHMRSVSDSPQGITLQQLGETAPTIITEQAGQGETVDLSDARAFVLGDEYADGIDAFLYENFRVTSGDVRYRVLRALTLRYASGIFGRQVSIDPESYTLTISDESIATDLMENTGFADEHIGLSLMVVGYGSSPLVVMVTSVESARAARFKYLDTSNVFSGMLPADNVTLRLAPYHTISNAWRATSTPAITVEALDTIGNQRLSDPAALEIQGARPLESFRSLGSWVSSLVPVNRMAFPTIETDGRVYVQIPFSQLDTPISVTDLSPRMILREGMRATSFGGRHWEATGYTGAGEFPDFDLVGAGSQDSLSHAVEFYYKVSSPGGDTDLAFPPFSVESRDVIVVIQIEDDNKLYGILLPVPPHVLNAQQIRGSSRSVLIPSTIEILKKSVSVNKDRAYIDKGYLDRPTALSEVNVYGSTLGITPRLEVAVGGDYDEGTPRPSGRLEARSEHISDFGGRRLSARLEARHDYKERGVPDDNMLAAAELSLSGGVGGIGIAASHRYDEVSDEYLSLVTSYGGQTSASLMRDGLYVTDPEARCEDVPSVEMTGFDHSHLAGDVAVNTSNVKQLSEELDAMRQREFGVLRQLSLLSAAAHETLDMLRTANATIRSLRDVQYELAMTLLFTLDNAGSFSDQDTCVRDTLIGRAGADLRKNMPHRLNKSLHLAGHALMTGLPYSNLPTSEDLSQYFFNDAHTSARADTFEDDAPLDYRRPGYTRVRTTDSLSIDQNEALNPLSDVLEPTTVGTSRAYYPLYTSATHVDREGTSRENVSWSSALNELQGIIQEARDYAISDFGGAVSLVSPAYSFRPRAAADNADDIANNAMCMYLMGIGYWSPTSLGHARAGSFLDRKARAEAAGWFFTTTTSRRVGPEQASITPDMRTYASGDNRTLSRATDSSGHNAAIYDDAYILAQVESGKDLIIGVAQSPVTGQVWSISRASLGGYPQLFSRSKVTAPADETRVYLSFDDAKAGSEVFYCVNIEEESPLPTVPGLYEEDLGSIGGLPIPMPTTYANTGQIINLYGAEPSRLSDYKFVYCRAWCVVRKPTLAELWSMLQGLGFQDNDPRINAIQLSSGEWAGIRTRLGMADFLKSFNYGQCAAPGQVRFSFNESTGGSYIRGDRELKTSKDSV